MGFQNSAIVPDLGFYAARSYSLDKAAEDGPAFNPLLGEIGERVIGSGRAELTAAMGPPPVVMTLVLGQDRPQMPLAEDQHRIGDLRPRGEHEPFRLSVRRRTPRRDLHDLDAGVGQNRVERCGELPGPVPDQEPEARGAVPRSISRLRICCTVQGPSGFAVTPRMCT